MAIQISISNAIGSRYRGSFVPPVDPDAQAFITAAAITNPTQQSAINQLVVDLKGYNIWTKFKAIYPIVGGTAAQHKWNLKDPRDLDAAFRLTFASGWTHSSTGMTPLNTYADTNLLPSSILTLNSSHLSFYSRTTSNGFEVEMGSRNSAGNDIGSLIEIRTSGVTYFRVNSGATYISASDADSKGFYISNRTASNVINGWKNSTKIATGTTSSSSLSTVNIGIGAWNQGGGAGFYSTKQCAFASIGDGLTDAEAANFYTAVQAFQTTLGRSIGTQTVSDADAQAFVTAANIDDQVQANAVNNLVIGMKADGLWTKMKAIYPVVGGVASSHAVNLKSPGTYNLTFSSGWTHTANGMTPSVAYADTSLIPNSVLSLNSTHISGYIRNNITSDGPILSAENAGSYDNGLYIWPKQSNTLYSIRVNDNTSDFAGVTYDVRGLHLAIRTASNVKKYRVNTTQIFNSTSASSALNTSSIYIGKSRNNANYFNNQIAFSSIGDGLDDTDATNLYNRVNTFQTTLSRQV